MATYAEYEKEIAKLDEWAQNYRDQNWCLYAALSNHLEMFLHEEDPDSDEDLDWDESGYECWLEEELRQFLPDIYEDWVKGEHALDGDGKGGFANDTSGYVWMLWGLHPDTLNAFTYVYEYACENNLPIPDWYKEYLE